MNYIFLYSIFAYTTDKNIDIKIKIIFFRKKLCTDSRKLCTENRTCWLSMAKKCQKRLIKRRKCTINSTKIRFFYFISYYYCTNNSIKSKSLFCISIFAPPDIFIKGKKSSLKCCKNSKIDWSLQGGRLTKCRLSVAKAGT